MVADHFLGRMTNFSIATAHLTSASAHQCVGNQPHMGLGGSIGVEKSDASVRQHNVVLQM